MKKRNQHEDWEHIFRRPWHLSNDRIYWGNAMSGFKHMFHDHPAKVGESYLEHMVFAFGFSARLFRAAFAALVHGVVPCLHETTASADVLAMHDEIVARRALMNHGQNDCVEQFAS